jgi:phenylalanyl-tRNA synthetase beta chain
MTISYNWLSEYLPAGQPGMPEKLDTEKLSKILTSIGLEVESLEKYEELKGGLEGLVIGEVIACEKHPDADKLSLTKVNIGSGELLQIVCGAPNVAIGQKVVVATVGATIYPTSGDPMTMKKAKIRGIESFGMICAEDEIGLSASHAGIMVLPGDVKPGTAAADYFKPYTDCIFEIGLTPNRMDAMSHLGVAKDVCAYLSHHYKNELHVKLPFKNVTLNTAAKTDTPTLPFTVTIENTDGCQRYAGICIQDVTIGESPLWLRQRLKSIGLRPINNIVDITNFILHETGQPLHAFDADKIAGKKIIVKNLAEGESFVTLDEKERKLSATDVMICNAEEPMCIAGVYGGLHSGVTGTTTNIFLESAWFNPISIRKTSFKHGLRTDAATRFEKGVDISSTVVVLKRAALMIKEIAGGTITSDLIDVYPAPKSKTEVALKYHYLKKLSGKNYHGDTIKNILTGLGFEIIKEGLDDIRIAVPFSKPDISIPADIVEEIMRIDGLDNVEIPPFINMSPAIETLGREAGYKEKIAAALTGIGFNEIFTNSITNAAYFTPDVLATTVKMINSLSADLNVMRPSMMETGLECVAYNLNRKNSDLQFFELGKTYSTSATGSYQEQQHLSLYITGKKHADSWKSKGDKADIYYAKSVCSNLLQLLGLQLTGFSQEQNSSLDICLQAVIGQDIVAKMGSVNKAVLDRFEIKQPVFYVDIDWDKATVLSKKNTTVYTGIPKFPSAQRDIAIVVDKAVEYATIERATYAAKVGRLTSVNLFDIFESEKLGANKKSMAINFTFADEEKTMTDKEIDAMMGRIIASYEKELGAEVRK